MIPPPPTSTLFPYTTLFRSSVDGRCVMAMILPRFRIEFMVGDRTCLSSTMSAVVNRVNFGLSTESLLARSEEHTSELQSHVNLVCRLLLEKKKKKQCILFIR